MEVKLAVDGVGGVRPLSNSSSTGDDLSSEARPLMLFESDRQLQVGKGVQISGTLAQPSAEGFAKVLLTNRHSLTHKVEGGTEVGHAVPVEVVEPEELEPQSETTDGGQSQVNVVTDSKAVDTHGQCPEKELISLLQQELNAVPEHERAQLVMLLEKCHDVFSLVEGERGETGLTEIHIDTGAAAPRKQPVRRVPFAVQQEVAKQLQRMQEDGVIQPSSSPWASAIVLVRKKDGSLRICIDYRHLNSVTKSDTFPLPRIDDLLDQLGSAKYFTTLDLAAGYWQIRVADDSIEKTAFITHNGLFEFRVMPFGLTNAPAIFQRLMQRALSGLNPAEGPDFVAVYIDDILIFSRTMEEHLHHIEQVLAQLTANGWSTWDISSRRRGWSLTQGESEQLQTSQPRHQSLKCDSLSVSRRTIGGSSKTLPTLPHHCITSHRKRWSSTGQWNVRRPSIASRRSSWRPQSWCTLTLNSVSFWRQMRATRAWGRYSHRSWKTTDSTQWPSVVEPCLQPRKTMR